MMFTTPTASVMVMALSSLTSAASESKFSAGMPSEAYCIHNRTVI